MAALAFSNAARNAAISLPVDRLHVPFACASKRLAVSSLWRGGGHGVESDIVGIVDQDQVIELEMAGERDRLLRDALLHAAVAGQRDDWLVENGVLRAC